MNPLLLTGVLSYLLGSIPFGYLLVRAFRGADVRETGSGNIGATNVARTSPGLGIGTLVLDALKGATAVLVTRALFPGDPTLAAWAAFVAIAGHMFPVWLRFRGGKGVATALGAFLLVAPKAVLVMVGVFAILVFLFRYVSLGSVVAVVFLPVLMWAFNLASPAVLLLSSAAAALIVAKHYPNIVRLFGGTEARFELRRG